MQSGRDDPTVTVVICTRNRPQLLENCLAALARQTQPVFDTLVVDNAPLPQVRDISQRYGARYIHEPVAGISRARNAGVRESHGDIVAFIDDDAIAESGWLESLLPVFRDPSIGAATGGTRYMKSYGGDRLMSAEIALEPIRPGRIYGRHDVDWFVSASFGGIGDGMNMAFRRSLFERQVRFDERLGRGRLLDGADEHVAFLSVLSAGYRIAHVPAATVRHPVPADPRTVAAQRISLVRSAIAYILFLWFEFPGHRAALTGFVRRAIQKRLKVRGPGAAVTRPASRWQVLWAVFAGPVTYFKARQEWKQYDLIAPGSSVGNHRRAMPEPAASASLRLRV